MKIFTVEELNTSLKDHIVRQFEYPITVKGQISNVRMPQSGHQYFKLTDDEGFNKHSIDCVIWKGRFAKLAKDYDSKEVLVTGNVTMYKATANCQIQINDIIEYGEGALKKTIEETRKKLEKEGLFKNKKDFPMYPENIGVITSSDSHALQDVLSKLEQRYPLADVIIYPSLVQGNEATQNIITQLRRCNRENRVDAIMLIRGGGSLEDLMVFNNEELAREIYKSVIPVVTGIGHQPDVTIADYVADAAMETPTAAAVFLTPDKYELTERFLNFDRQLKKSVQTKINTVKELYFNITNKINIYNPKNMIENLRIKQIDLQKHLRSHIKLIYNEHLSKLDLLSIRKKQVSKIIHKIYIDNLNEIKEASHRLRKMSIDLYNDKYKIHKTLHQELIKTNPIFMLKKGFTIIRDSKGKILKSKAQVQNNQILSAEFKDGYVDIKKVTSKK